MHIDVTLYNIIVSLFAIIGIFIIANVNTKVSKNDGYLLIGASLLLLPISNRSDFLVYFLVMTILISVLRIAILIRSNKYKSIFDNFILMVWFVILLIPILFVLDLVVVPGG
jgi:hypothetical protein